ncbi:hypothetical protein ACQP25_44570 (plasmid) [Microtetraspora malaysiensis]|uniref:hypothetical protein n=1 Tax=Microtetraspora malaysiensis TaxID=161358 RepID=UPI003D94DEE5
MTALDTDQDETERIRAEVHARYAEHRAAIRARHGEPAEPGQAPAAEPSAAEPAEIDLAALAASLDHVSAAIGELIEPVRQVAAALVSLGTADPRPLAFELHVPNISRKKLRRLRREVAEILANAEKNGGLR